MPDTQRSLAALQALLADNIQKAISPADLRDFLVSVFPTVALQKVALTYGATIAVDASLGELQILTVTNGTAFTIQNPINPPAFASSAQRLTFDIYNNSGGAMGVVTWDTNFKLAGAFTNPANGQHRLISFQYDGARWREVSRSPADQAN
jgi:hypothetical protein